MRFHRLALSTVAVLALGAFSGNNVLTAADETAAAETATTTENYTVPANAETHGFQAEVNRMLDIVINSLYQNKDVFLRELISNASDALDKIRFLSIENPDLLKEKEDLEVRIQYDETLHTVTVTDSGIGMTHDDLLNNLGTVARSGTTKFLDALKEGADIGTIGMFGVGFYSSFLVSDRVRVASKHPDDPVQHVWESVNGEDSFHLYDDPRGNSLGRGTEITLYLKEDAYDYASNDKLNEVAQFYSEFISHPIHLKRIYTEQVPVEIDEVEVIDEEKDSGDDEEEDLEVGEDEDTDEEAEEKEPEMEEVTKEEWTQLNTEKPIWAREKESITDKEYKEFYKTISRGEQNWSTYWTHFNAEGNINFKSIVYLPSQIPQELKMGRPDQAKKGVVKLYVRKVLISDEFPLLPVYLGWVKGVVDSDDLPLNVNRETLQESKIIKIIGKKLVRKILEMMKKLSNEPHPQRKVVKTDDSSDDEEDKIDEVEIDADGNMVETEKDSDEDDDEEDEMEDDPDVDHPYIEFYKKFNQSLKMGVMRDDANRSRLSKLLRFKTSKFSDEKDWVSFGDYVDRMPEWQKDIYYISALSLQEAEASHFMKKFNKNDVEVMYFTEPVDEIMMQHMKEYEGKKVVLISKDGVKLPNEDEDLEKRRETIYKKKFKPLTDYLNTKLDVMRIQISSRLDDVPALVSSTSFGPSSTMERVNGAQVFAQQSGLGAGHTKILEINPRHPIITKLLENVTPPADMDEDDADDFKPSQETLDLTRTMYDMALVNSGYRIFDIKGLSKRLTRVLKSSMDLENLDLAAEIELPEPEEGEDDDDDDEEFDMDSMGGMGGMGMDGMGGMGMDGMNMMDPMNMDFGDMDMGDMN